MQVHDRQLGNRNELRGWVSDNLTHILEFVGQLDQARQFARTALEICECAYPTNSTAVAYQKLRLARLCPDTETALHKEALQVLSIHFGNIVDV